MAVAKKKPDIKSAVISNTITSSVSNLKMAQENTGKAVSERTSESKKLMLETRRLKKRRVAQMIKKKRAVAANKKNQTAESGKEVKAVASELVATDKLLVKTTAVRQAVLAELSGLKENLKILNAYMKGINTAERALARKNSKTKRRARQKVLA